jgi:hypothetical protein
MDEAMISALITIVYYAMVAYIAALLVYNLIKTRTWEKELLYLIVLLPFLLRLFRLK